MTRPRSALMPLLASVLAPGAAATGITPEVAGLFQRLIAMLRN